MWQSTGQESGKKEWKDKSHTRSLQDRVYDITEQNSTGIDPLKKHGTDEDLRKVGLRSPFAENGFFKLTRYLVKIRNDSNT